MTPLAIRAEVSFSLFTDAGSALGRISGPMDFVVLPRIGETISFLFSLDGKGSASSGAPSIQPKVETVMHSFGLAAKVLLMLEPVFVDSPDAAERLAAFLAAGFDLFYEPYGEGAL